MVRFEIEPWIPFPAELWGMAKHDRLISWEPNGPWFVSRPNHGSPCLAKEQRNCGAWQSITVSSAKLTIVRFETETWISLWCTRVCVVHPCDTSASSTRPSIRFAGLGRLALGLRVDFLVTWYVFKFPRHMDRHLSLRPCVLPFLRPPSPPASCNTISAPI